MKHKITAMLFITLFFIPSLSFARYQITFTPGVTVQDLYDDNIDLERDNEKDDYISTISLSFNLNVLSEKNDFSFQYSPSLVRYKEEDQNNTIRHSGTLFFSEDLNENLVFEIIDTYLQSEDPIEEAAGIIGVRSTRNVYQRNAGRAGIIYAFGTENTISLGYDLALLENEDVTLDDGMTLDPYADLTYWFNVKNGTELSYRYTIANFTRDDNIPPGDDYSGNAAGLRYIHRFTPHTTFSIGYNLTMRDFDGPSENYDINEGSLGLNHEFSPRTSFEISGGYFGLANEQSEGEGGLTYQLSLSRTLERGSLTISGSGGWNEAYLEAERRGLTRYKALDSSFEYQVAEAVSNYAGISYRQDRDNENIRSRTVRVNYGWQLMFLRYFYVSLDYTCLTRDDDQDMQDYMVNRVMLNLTASKLYRW